MNARRHVVLWGPPGVGKSSVGRALARRLGVAFQDLDEVIERSSGRAPAAILRESGEPAFRALERSALSDLLSSEHPAVVAVGGGALVSQESRELALRAATVIGLAAEEPTLSERLARDPGDRPLLGEAGKAPDRERLVRQLAERRAAYAIAHELVTTDGDDVDGVAQRIAAQLAAGLYPLTISADCAYAVHLTMNRAAEEVGRHVRRLSPTRVFVVTDETVGRLHLARLLSALSSATVITLPCGEEHKTAAAVLAVARGIADGGGDRGSLVVALGGGVVTDLAGFAASIFARGVRWLAVPTSVVGMVDAATGGKTGANLGAGKNLIGTFHHPVAVIVDPAWSATESDRAVRSGLAEVVKTAVVGDAALFAWLEARASSLAGRDPEALREAIARSVAIKARVVEQDPRERGLRIILNFGHTLGHALEAETGFARLTHGEAVSVGMVLACRIGQALGRTPAAAAHRVETLLAALGLPVTIEPSVLGGALSHISLDKKRLGALLRFVVLDDLGSASTSHVTEDQLRRALGVRD